MDVTIGWTPPTGSAWRLIANYHKLWNVTDTNDLLGPLPPAGTPQAADRASLDGQLERLERMLGRDIPGPDDIEREGR